MDAIIAPAALHHAIRASADDVRSASAWLEQAGSEHDLPAEQIFRLDLCLNEALGNIIFHGGPSALENPVLLRLNVKLDNGHGQAALSVSDTGTPFNPLAAVPAQQAATLADATPGGLGLTMITSYCDRLDYDFRDGRNHLTFNIWWDFSA
jgi:serine/threonine-protein kinase RsbW